MNRRDFLACSITPFVLAGCAASARSREREASYVMTVRGPVASHELGLTLPHEHVLVDFIGAQNVSPDRYDRNEVFEVARPFLEQVRALGCQSIFECTPAYLGRDPVLLRELSEATGLHLVTNTGYYGARDDQHIPPDAFSESAEQIAARWIREFTDGIDETGVRPGFMKIGVDGGELSGMDQTLVRAAALAHLETGLTIASHTGPAVAAFDQIDVLHEVGVDPSAWIWVHAQGESDPSQHVHAGQSRAWVSFDGLAPTNVEQYVAFVSNMKAHDLLDRVLISHDAGWYHVGEPGGGTFRAFDTLFTLLFPALRAAGFTDEEIHTLTVRNPAEAFAIRVRRGNS